MTFLKSLLACFLFAFFIHPALAQTTTEGSPSLALAAVKIARVNPTLGIVLGFEFGLPQLKGGISILSTPVFANAGTSYQTAHSLTGGPDIQVACDSRAGFFNFGLNVRYYAFSTEETVGSNFYGGLGIGLGFLAKKTEKGSYDESAYQLENSFIEAFGSDTELNSGYSAILSAGYEYSFESGFSLIAGVGYNYIFSEFDYEADLGRIDAFTVSTGIKYSFLMDFQGFGTRFPYPRF